MKYFLFFFLCSVAMAETKISQLPLYNGANIGTGDSFPFVSVASSITGRMRVTDILSAPAVQSPTFTGTVTANAFSGNGVAVTNVIASAVNGVTDGSNAASPLVGQTLATSVNTGTTYPTTTNAWTDCSSLSVPAGRWLLWGLVHFEASGAKFTQHDVGISTNSGNNPTGLTFPVNAAETSAIATGVASSTLATPLWYQSIGATQTYYLKCRGAWTASAPTYGAALNALRH